MNARETGYVYNSFCHRALHIKALADLRSGKAHFSIDIKALADLKKPFDISKPPNPANP